MFADARKYNYHLRLKHRETSKTKRQCQYCKIEFVGNLSELKKHRLVCDRRNEPITCDECGKYRLSGDKKLKSNAFIAGKTFSTLPGYRYHAFSHKKNSIPGYVLAVPKKMSNLCEICGVSYKTEERFNNHMITVHSEMEEQIKCDQCPKRFKTQLTLKSHQVTVHQENASACNVCGKVMKNRSALLNHRIIHKQVKKSA